MFPPSNRKIVRQDSVTTVIKTGECIYCHQDGEVAMPTPAFIAWVNGEFIQRVWPEGSAGDREQLINGTHDECFNKMFPEEEE